MTNVVNGWNERFVAVNMGDNRYDVIHLGPYTVSKSLKLEEALSLARALNQECKERGI